MIKKRGSGKKLESQYIKGVCVECKKNKQTSCGVVKVGKNKGKRKYKNVCAYCSIKKSDIRMLKHKTRTKNNHFPWFKHKKKNCEDCGFVAIHPCQLDVDHIDGNKNNNNLSNYKTLCSNCHRLKTFLNKEWVPYKNR